MRCETCSVDAALCAEKLQHRCADIAEACAGAKVNSMPDFITVYQHGDVLAGVVCPAVAGVAAVVGGYDKHIIAVHFLHKSAQPLIKCVERFCITHRVAAVTVAHIEINKVRKAQPLEITGLNAGSYRHVGIVAYLALGEGYPLACKNYTRRRLLYV